MARQYFEDGSYELACPPLQALLSIMVDGHYQGQQLDAPQLRHQFTRESLLISAWYRARLNAKRTADIQLWQRHRRYLKHYCTKATHQEVVQRLNLKARIEQANQRLEFFKTDDYLARIEGTLGTDPALIRAYDLDAGRRD